MFNLIAMIFFAAFGLVMSIVGICAARKADQYKTRLDKIEKATWNVYSDLSADKTYKETLDDLMQNIYSSIND